ncbi:MAG: hypothetical protein WEB88_06315 [Gemmatimonadota bacterium]
MKATMILHAMALTLAAGAAGCAAGASPAAMDPAPAPSPGTEGGGAAPEAQEEGLVPAGFGTLRLDDISLQLRSGALEVRITPLAESVTRLAAPDIHERLSATARSAVARGADADHDLLLVSFFSDRPDVPFQPEDLELVVQGRTHRPQNILPTTPGWTRQRLNQQENQSAVYVFRADADLAQGSLVVGYGAARSDDWSRVIPRLQDERSRVRARAGGG